MATKIVTVEDTEDILLVTATIAYASRIVVVVGAGISEASGIPVSRTFTRVCGVSVMADMVSLA